MSFKDDVMRFAEKTERRERTVFFRSVRDAHESAAIGSALTGSSGQPVYKGYLRASVQVGPRDGMRFTLAGDGSDNTGTPESPMPMTPIDPGVAAGMLSGDIDAVMIASNVPHAPAVEHRHNAHAKSFESTRVNFDRIVEKNLRDVTGGAP